MKKQQQNNEFQISGLGWDWRHFYVSNAVSPFISLYLIFSIFCILPAVINSWRWLVISWIVFSVLLFILFTVVLILYPNLMRSEGYNLNLKKLELGEKGKLLEAGQTVEIVQPVKVEQNINAKATIKK